MSCHFFKSIPSFFKDILCLHLGVDNGEMIGDDLRLKFPAGTEPMSQSPFLICQSQKAGLTKETMSRGRRD